MSIKLYEHNRVAYDSALAMLRSSGKAVIIHPTGTGKSFIGFKLAEDHPSDRVLWLSPSEYIVKTQLENLKRESGDELNNITFVTYVRLMLMTEAEILKLKPDWIIMDEFHRCGAERWSDGVANLLSAYPGCPTLGLSATNIRYLDGQRDMAAELFDGNVASEMTLGEAIVRGILLKPKYVVTMYGYEDELESLRKKVSASKNEELRVSNQAKLDALCKSLAKADGIDIVFDRHIVDRTGKYIIFCPDVEGVASLKKLAKQWFRLIDTDPRVYSVHSYFDESVKEFEAFKADNSEHIKLLYCVDMLNEGIHVDNISGVILCRLTVSPTVYKQQIGRALSASKTNEAVIFDLVNNFRNLCSVSSVSSEVSDAVNRYRSLGMDAYIVNDSFTVVDEVRDSVELFEALEDTLSVSWDKYYGLAKRYYEENGNLNVSVSFKTSDGVALGRWLEMERLVRRGFVAGLLTPERIARLDAIGMRWERVTDLRWDALYAHALEYYNEHGGIDVKLNYQSPDGYRLGSVLCDLRKSRKKQSARGMLNEERVSMLDELGMRWENRGSWERCFPAAEKYFSEHGDLRVPNDYETDDGIKLGGWLCRVRRGTVKLTDGQKRKLESMGYREPVRQGEEWYVHYSEIKEFYRENGHSSVKVLYRTKSGFRLGVWARQQRMDYAEGKLSSEKVELLNELDFKWDSPDNLWERQFAEARRYYEEHGNLKINVTDRVNGVLLGPWIKKQRELRKSGELSEAKIRRLSEIGMEWQSLDERRWEKGFENACKYYKDHRNLDVPLAYKCDDGSYLGNWLNNQRKNWMNGRLDPERAKRLDSIGMVWSK